MSFFQSPALVPPDICWSPGSSGRRSRTRGSICRAPGRPIARQGRPAEPRGPRRSMAGLGDTWCQGHAALAQSSPTSSTLLIEDTRGFHALLDDPAPHPRNAQAAGLATKYGRRFREINEGCSRRRLQEATPLGWFTIPQSGGALSIGSFTAPAQLGDTRSQADLLALQVCW